MRRVDKARALAALEFMASEDRRPKSVEEPGPKGVGFNTLWNLADGGFLDHASDTEFVISQKGLAALQTGRLDWPTTKVAAATAAPAPSSTPPKRQLLRQPRRARRDFVSQEQIAAVFKAAREAGIRVEMRIENGAVRFLPYDPTGEALGEDEREGHL